MDIIIGLFFLHLIESVQLEEIVDSTLILRRAIHLDCKYSGNETVIQAQWSKVNGSLEEAMCTIHKRYGKYISQKYMGRLSFVAENSSDLSIILKETSEADIGIYVCYLAVFPIGTVKKVIAVQADDFGTIVPSSHQIFQENTDIVLNFLYTLQVHVKKVTVQKFTDGKMDLVAHCEHLINGKKLLSYGIDFSKHSFLNCSDLQNITLTIHQAAITDEGLYRCHFWLDDKNHTISIEVHLQTTGITSMSTFALICVTSLLVIIVIFTIAAFCLVRRQNNKRIQVKQVNVSFNSAYPQLDIETMDEEHTYANFVPNSYFSKLWT